MRTLGQLSAWAVLALATAACSGKAIGATGGGDNASGAGGVSGAGGASQGGGSGNSVFDPYTTAFCGLARTCCERAGFSTTPLANCEADVLSQSDVPGLTADGTVIVDPAKLAACAAAISASSSACVLDRQSVQSICRTFYEGTRREGESCQKAEECIGKPVVCLKDQSMPPGTAGTCHDLTRATTGSPCLWGGDDALQGITASVSDKNPPLGYCRTSDGLYCPLATKICTKFTAPGAPCTDFNECGPGYFCDTTCVAVRPQGGACQASEQCTTGLGCLSGVCAEPVVATAKLCGGDYH